MEIWSQSFLVVKDSVSKSRLSAAQKAELLRATWTLDQVPQITNTTQYGVYVEIHGAIARTDTESEHGIKWSQSPVARLALAYRQRMAEWET